MLHYSVVFLVIALAAASLGFGVHAGAAAAIAGLMFIAFLMLATTSRFAGWLRRR